MKPVLIQTLHRHNQKKKALVASNIDTVHGGPKDRSGFIILLIRAITFILGLAFS